MANPLKPEHSAADEHYKRTFATSKQLEEMEEEAAADSPENQQSDKDAKDTSNGSATIKKLEEDSVEGHWKTKKIGDTTTTSSFVGGRRLSIAQSSSAYGFIVVLLILGIWFSTVFAPNIILVNIKEMFTNDLTDATVALYEYDKKLMDHKIGKADCSKKESIKCKLTTMSRNQVKSLERAGFTVEGDKVTEDNLDDNDHSNNKPESRYKVTSITFPHKGGTATSAASFEENANKSSALKALTYSVFNPKSSFFMDERYKQRIKWRYDLTKEPEVSGTTADAVDESFNEAMQGSDEEIDDAGQGAFSLKTLAGSGKSGLEATANRVGEQSNSYTQLQCAFYTQGKVVSNATRKAKEITAARFAMQYLKAADQAKSDVGADEITINALSSKLAWSSDGGYNGKNATDSNIYKHIVFGEPISTPRGGQMYTLNTFDSIGALATAWLQFVLLPTSTSETTQGITNAPGNLSQPPSDIGKSAREYCLHGQTTQSKSFLKNDHCPALTIAAAPPPMIPAVAPIAAGSNHVCPPPPKGGIFLMWPISTVNATAKVLMPYVAGVFNGAVSTWADENAKNFTADTKGIDASNAIFSGTGAILGDMAMSRGMRPGDKALMTQYLSHKADIEKEFAEVARYNARNEPFNIMNQYSFMGSLARSLNINYDQKSPLLTSIGTIFSAIPASMKHIGGSSASAFFYIQPHKLDPSRIGKCEDAESNAIGIELDVACNVRYGLSTKDLNPDLKSVLEYMLKSHPDETKENIKELEERQGKTDFERDMADVQRQVQQAKEGSDAKMIDEKTGKPGKYSEYEKFMTYCVNREDPWGRTGMAVRREGLSDDEKEERMKYRTPDNEPLDKDDDHGDPYEMLIANDGASAYMAVTEGAAADQDWYTGKKCLEESEMLHNFRAYTMMCMADASHSGGAPDCTELDKDRSYQFDGFYNNNDVIYTSWW